MDAPTPEHWQRVVDNTGLVWFHLHRCRMTDAEREEAFGDGCLGLLRAAQKFDPDLGYTFATYAMYWIRQAIGRGRLERAGRNARYADTKGVDYAAPVSLDMLVGEDETMTLGDTVADLGPLPDDRSVAAIRLERMYAAMLASARDVLDVAIIDGLKDEYGWQRRVAEREGVTSEAIRRRWARLRQAAIAADEGVGLVGGSFDETEVRRAMLDDDTMVDPFEAPATRELRARRASRAQRAVANDTADS